MENIAFMREKLEAEAVKEEGDAETSSETRHRLELPHTGSGRSSSSVRSTKSGTFAALERRGFGFLGTYRFCIFDLYLNVYFSIAAKKLLILAKPIQLPGTPAISTND